MNQSFRKHGKVKISTDFCSVNNLYNIGIYPSFPTYYDVTNVNNLYNIGIYPSFPTCYDVSNAL